MHEFTLKLPKLTTKTVWIGFYTEMFGTVVVLWGKKPKWDKVLECYSDDGKIATVMEDDFEAWFGSLQPFVDDGLLVKYDDGYVVADKSLDCVEVTRTKITGVFNQYGHLCGLSTDVD